MTVEVRSEVEEQRSHQDRIPTAETSHSISRAETRPDDKAVKEIKGGPLTGLKTCRRQSVHFKTRSTVVVSINC